MGYLRTATLIGWAVAAVAVGIAAGAWPAWGQAAAEGRQPESAPSGPASSDAKAESPQAEPAPEPAKAEKPTAKLLETRWYLLTCEGDKIGYVNAALYEAGADEAGYYRLEVRRFLKGSLGDVRPGILEDSVMRMDKDWSAVSFTSNRRGVGAEGVSVEGTVANEALTLTVTSGGAKRTSTIPVRGKPTFAGAFLLWVGKQKLEDGRTFSRTTIDERDGTFQGSPRMARAIQKVELTPSVGSQSTYYVVAEQSNLMVNANKMGMDGRLFLSEGRNHNLSLHEATLADGMRLKLDGNVNWQNRIPGKTGDAFSCETFGYKLSLPAYPYVPVAGPEGRFLTAENLAGEDSMHLLVLSARGGDAGESARKLYESWSKMLGPTEEVAESKATVDGLPALVWQGKAKSGGRDASFKVAIIVRGELGYVVGHLRFWPAGAGGTDAFEKFVESISWTKVFGRERGHWEGEEYVSDVLGYRLRLLGPGWRLPEERTGVATNIEAVREDRSGVLTVTVEGLAKDVTLAQAAAAYVNRIKERVPGAVEPSQEEGKLDGRAAVVIRYEGKAIDGEATESRHLLAADGGRIYILTFVTKKGSLESNLPRFNEAVESFRMGKADEGTETDH